MHWEEFLGFNMFTLFCKISQRHIFKFQVSNFKFLDISTGRRMSLKVSWSQVKDVDKTSRPKSRSSHGVSVIGDTLYMLGGEHEARQVKDKIPRRALPNRQKFFSRSSLFIWRLYIWTSVWVPHIPNAGKKYAFNKFVKLFVIN